MSFRKLAGAFMSAMICACLLGINAYADESTESDILTDASGRKIVEATDTSVIYDMGHLMADQISEKNQRYNNRNNPYSSLKAPTQIVYEGGYYFIVDCYHDQVLYSANLKTNIKDWQVMTNDVELPHAIASDGSVYLVTDTENNRILVFERKNGRFQNTQKFENIGVRPHYIKYDAETNSFYVWSSMTGEMYIMRRDEGANTVFLDEVRFIKELMGLYVRSFTISGNQILFPAVGSSSIIIADKNTLEVLKRFPVTPQISGMVQVMPIGSYFYITVSTDANYNQSKATIIRTNDLASLADGIYENIYPKFQSKGIPYYIEYMNNMYYITCPSDKKSVWRFNIVNDAITNVSTVY